MTLHPGRPPPRPAPTRGGVAAIRRVFVGRLAGETCRGKIVVSGQAISCALGRSGLTRRKREGDGATPVGTFRLAFGLHRADRLRIGPTSLRLAAIRPDDAWCDDPEHPRYNRPVRLPFPASHERLWRSDELYDGLLVLDYNLRHPIRGRGSAIFLHVAGRDLPPTAGCVAVRKEDLRRLLPRLSRTAKLVIQG